MSEVITFEKKSAGDIWLSLYPKNRNQSEANIHKCFFYDKALSTIKNLHPDLWNCEEGLVISEKKFRRLYEDFSDGVENNLAALRFFYRGIFRGNELKRWELPLPPLPLKIPREKNTISVKSFSKEFLPRQKLTSAFLKSLESESPESVEKRLKSELPETVDKRLKSELPETVDKRLAQVLLSSILFGGLVRKDWITPWVKALEENVSLLDKILWLDMEDAEKSDRENPDNPTTHKDKIRRRWVADSLTQLLLIRWFKEFPRERRNVKSIDPWESIELYLSDILEGKEGHPRNLEELLNWARAGLRMNVPPYLAAYACGSLHAVSLSEEAWLRVATGKNIPIKRPPKEAGVISPDFMQKHLQKEKKQGDFVQEDLLKNLIKQINLADAGKLDFNRKKFERLGKLSGEKLTLVQKALILFFSENKHKMVPVLQDLCKWAIHLLEEPKPHHRHFHYQKLVPSSVDRYLHAIGFVLIGQFDDEELEDLNAGDFEEIYGDVIESHSSFKERRYCLAPLTRFHGYVQHFNNVDDSDLVVLSKRGKVTDSIDANILLPPSYKRARGYLGFQSERLERIERMQIIALILGYRCGLRRSEIRGLRVADIEPGYRSMLKVRRTNSRRLKSRSSARRLPLADLLTDQEFIYLQTWRDDRIKESPGQFDSLFLCDTGSPYELLKPERLFSPITEALQIATDDETFRFHHLRRSFAQLHFVNMDRQVLGGDATWLKHDLAAFSPEPERLGRGNLYAICALLGHSSPETTMRHYVHVADFMLGMALRNRDVEPVLSVDAILAVSGCPEWTVYYHYDQKTERLLCPLVNFFKCDKALAESLKPRRLIEAQQATWTRRGRKSRKYNLPSWEDALENAYRMVDSDPCPDLSFEMSEAQLRLAALFYRNLRNLSSTAFSTTSASLLHGFNSYLGQEASLRSFVFDNIKDTLSFVKAIDRVGSVYTANVFISGLHADHKHIALTLPLERSQWNDIQSKKCLHPVTENAPKFEVFPEWLTEKNREYEHAWVSPTRNLAPGFLLFLYVIRCYLNCLRTTFSAESAGRL